MSTPPGYYQGKVLEVPGSVFSLSESWRGQGCGDQRVFAYAASTFLLNNTIRTIKFDLAASSSVLATSFLPYPVSLQSDIPDSAFIGFHIQWSSMALTLLCFLSLIRSTLFHLFVSGRR